MFSSPSPSSSSLSVTLYLHILVDSHGAVRYHTERSCVSPTQFSPIDTFLQNNNTLSQIRYRQRGHHESSDFPSFTSLTQASTNQSSSFPVVFPNWTLLKAEMILLIIMAGRRAKEDNPLPNITDEHLLIIKQWQQ